MAVIAMGTAGVLGAGTPALAHDRLLSSTPEDGAELDAAPDEITLTFSGEIMEIGAAITVLDGRSTPVTEGEIVIDGPEAAQALAPDLADGGYAVRWRVVSGDGHPISGGFTFTVGNGVAAPPAPAATPGATASAPASPPAGAAAPGEPAIPARTPVLAAAGAAAGLGLYLLVVALLRRRARAKSGRAA
ncbi:copper resistance CopC family protein [Marinactinospora rubrisoli]|uniref:Copper resistance protein CopC n=1 Tax=Marinactinospora rubrisoli TaxID=2715399 RepID=A0ABW2KIS7_9ACTN